MSSSSLEFLKEVKRRAEEDNWDSIGQAATIATWVLNHIDELIGLYQTSDVPR